MHIIPPFLPGVTLRHRDGAICRYTSIHAVFKALGSRWLRDNLGFDLEPLRVCTCHQVGPRFDDPLSVAQPAWSIAFDSGEPILASDFGRLVAVRPFPFWDRRYGTYNGFGPVPGSGRRRRRAHYFRRIRYIGERRTVAFVLDEDGETPPRSKRNGANLPDSWNDYDIAARNDRNWKRFRKTRWRD